MHLRVSRNLYFLAILLSLLSPTGRCSAAVEDLLKLSEDKIDVGAVAFALAKEIYPNVDVATYSSKIDDLANQVRRLARGATDPDQRIRCLNTVLYLHEKLEANRDSSFPRKSDNYFLNRLLDTKQGNCFSMPLLYVAVGQRLGWPIHLVHVPDHSFVRYVDPSFREQNIEATSGGGYISDEKYAKDFMVSEKGRKKGTYLRTLTYRELIGDLVANNAIAFGQKGQLEKAITYLKLSTRLNPRLIDGWANLVNAHKMLAKQSEGRKVQEYLEMAEKYSRKLDELGFVHPKDVPQFTSARRPSQ